MTRDLLTLSDWLDQFGVTHVVLESTGVYWRPVFNVLEDGRVILLVNPQQRCAAGDGQSCQDGVATSDAIGALPSLAKVRGRLGSQSDLPRLADAYHIHRHSPARVQALVTPEARAALTRWLTRCNVGRFSGKPGRRRR